MFIYGSLQPQYKSTVIKLTALQNTVYRVYIYPDGDGKCVRDAITLGTLSTSRKRVKGGVVGVIWVKGRGVCVCV